MADDTSITPALTPEQWAEVREDKLGEGDFLDSYGGEHSVRGGREHALVALLLHNQPFGFTWGDVDLLRATAQYVVRGDRLNLWGREADRLNALADRIAALLPPRQ